MITAKIDVLKILKEHLYQGRTAKYLDIVLFENKDGKSEYGDDGFVVQGLSKEARERGEKGPIIGNWKRMAPKVPSAPAPKPAPSPADESIDDVPF